ncbi:MAG: hypothetical protein K2H09_02415, partial [Treponemataceae bacterium]|nr:hypothetical protein [Treponemataceae bacterium]
PPPPPHPPPPPPPRHIGLTLINKKSSTSPAPPGGLISAARALFSFRRAIVRSRMPCGILPGAFRSDGWRRRTPHAGSLPVVRRGRIFRIKSVPVVRRGQILHTKCVPADRRGRKMRDGQRSAAPRHTQASCKEEP